MKSLSCVQSIPNISSYLKGNQNVTIRKYCGAKLWLNQNHKGVVLFIFDNTIIDTMREGGFKP